MKRYDYLNNIIKASSNESAFVTETIDCNKGVTIDFSVAARVGREYGAYAAKVLNCTVVADVKNLPEGIIGCYAIVNGIVIRQKYIDKGNYVVYCETLNNYVDITGPKAVASLLKRAEHKSVRKEFYCINNSVFPSRIIWSNLVKNTYKQKYNENPLDKLVLLFVNAESHERFKERYYSALREAVTNNFLLTVKQKSRDMGVPFYALTNCSLTSATQVLPNNNYIGFSSFYDKVFLRCQKELVSGEFFRRYFKIFTNISREKIIAEISFENFRLLPLKDLKCFIDRLFASGIKQICISGTAFLTAVLKKKKQIIENYINILGAALNEGKRVTEMLVIYPSTSAACEFNTLNPADSQAFNSEIEQIIDMLNRADILYDFASEYQIGNEVKISGALITANGNTYIGLIIMPGKTISPRLAGFIIKYAQNGGRIYALCELPQMIDGFKSSKLPELHENIKQITRSEMHLLRQAGSPLFTDMSVDLYAARLPDNSMIYFASNIIEESGSFSVGTYDSLTHIDIVNMRQTPCSLTDNIGKVTGKQIVELDNDYIGSALIRIGRPSINAAAPVKFQYVQMSVYFDIESCDDNSWVIDRCSYRHKKGRWKPAAPVTEVLKRINYSSKHPDMEFKFEFSIGKHDSKTRVLLYFKNQNRYTLCVNMYPVLCSGNSCIDITEYVKEGENYIIISSDNFLKLIEVDQNALSSLVLRGNFCVVAKSQVRNEEGIIKTANSFSMAQMAEAVSIEHILESGFWFFDGRMVLRQKFVVDKDNDVRYLLSFRQFYALAAEISVNGREAGDICFAPYIADITEHLVQGENEIRLNLYANQENFRILNNDYSNELIFDPFSARMMNKEDKKVFLSCFDISKHKQINGVRTGILRSINFSINKGEFVAVFGDKGSGKTTLFNILGCMDNANSGTIRLGDREITGLSNSQMDEFRKTEVAFIFADDNLIDNFTVSENIELACSGVLSQYSLNLVLHSAGISDKLNCYPKELNYEQKKRAAIARALAKNPQMILCDEPTALIDEEAGIRVAKLLKETGKLTEKTVIVFTSEEAVCDMADRVIRLKNGVVVDNFLLEKRFDSERI